ncbi:RDD family protein [Nocardia huaxiensis]|uniref:RDD family protein n=1 Tax=Nocardia huaxiensis TaxID=2755382 RepID=A0A7D6VFU0_9NOCA|nr:RDD family protein [Nocardia huaxiensis]QLY33462.1 RDD family protein [Nocardia huaxiensis]UFS99627.1 RDD family protein [Nocardia huaxiensis]
MARITGSWLSGPNADSGNNEPGDYPGKDLGLPESGAGALAPMMRRIVALMVDWFMSIGLAALIVRPNADEMLAKMTIPEGQQPPSDFTLIMSQLSTPTLLVWFAIGVIAVTLFGFTPGQYFLKMRVIRVDAAAPVGFVRALARQVILLFVIPALFSDADGRGMHDRATGTALAYAR